MRQFTSYASIEKARHGTKCAATGLRFGTTLHMLTIAMVLFERDRKQYLFL